MLRFFFGEYRLWKNNDPDENPVPIKKKRTTEKKLEQINLPHTDLALLIRDKMFVK